ncbi:hypothetical protein CHARACLAT_002634 [Characodon lateralis]|uniref:Uncharacterized protein n=1 Tax=Characodon lateralis TaxID=208331 RepID=A0ABU7F028_9TELE|nr:hypothetical protein [Characodon lateralis]
MGASSDKVSLLSGLLMLVLCVISSLCQEEYSGYHSGEKHTYEESSAVDHYNNKGSRQPEHQPEPTQYYGEDQQLVEEDNDPTRVTMITEDVFPFATTTESHYAKEDTETMQVPFKYPGGPDTDTSEEESGGDAALGEEGPTECDCEVGEPGFAGFAGPKGSRGLQGQTGLPGIQGREGYKGAKGVRGRGGDRGPVGDAGPEGEEGASGFSGGMGEPGLQGDPGERGEIGLKGDIGMEGPRGRVGAAGETGPRGDPGPPGSREGIGIKGSRGDLGKQGSQGKDGPKGQTGAPGFPGDVGERGYTGYPGQAGPFGPHGPKVQNRR